MTFDWNATAIAVGVLNDIKGDSFYAFLRIYDNEQNDFRIAYSKVSNKLQIMRTVNGEDETLREI